VVSTQGITENINVGSGVMERRKYRKARGYKHI
jgi:hypothetical protein